MELNRNYWQNKYTEAETTWDLGRVSPPLKAYFDQLTNKNMRILIPGAGRAHEAAYLNQQGFKAVTVLDIAPAAIEDVKRLHHDFPASNLICADFFSFQGQFDCIVEQTFFCALPPEMRKAYVETTHRLLKSQGKLIGLLFNCEFENDGPPFGGNEEEYRELFGKHFIIKTMKTAYNSIEKREGRELFINLEKL